MSYVALATQQFEECVRFYSEQLGFPTVREWDRPTARGRVFDLGGLRLELLDATREKRPMLLPPPGDRFHLVIEVEDIHACAQRLGSATASPSATTWGAWHFQLLDPEGVSVHFIQWDGPAVER